MSAGTTGAVALAVDLGGTKIDAALITDAGEPIAASRSRALTGSDSTPETLTAAITKVVSHALTHLPDGTRLAGTGVGSAGPIDIARGTISPVNLRGAHGFDLVGAVTDAVIASTGDLNPHVVLGHDGGCLALAESWLGAARGSAASLSIVVSTGVGGGVVMHGAPVRGASGNAGHIGQMTIDDLTVEEVASGPSSVRWAQLQGWRGTSGEELGRAARDGDDIARRAIERSAEAVGRAIADAGVLLDLEIAVIGGGFSAVSDDYVDLVQHAVVTWAVLPFAKSIRVARSSLGGDGPIIGAAALALRGA